MAGTRRLPAGAWRLNGSQIEAWPGRQRIVTDHGALQWCALEEASAPLCITMVDAHTAEYREATGAPRVWCSAPPVLQEEPIAFPLTWRLAVKQIDPSRGVSFQSTVGRGDQRLTERGFGFVPSGSGADLGARYPNLRFVVRIEGADRAVIEAAQ